MTEQTNNWKPTHNATIDGDTHQVMLIEGDYGITHAFCEGEWSTRWQSAPWRNCGVSGFTELERCPDGWTYRGMDAPGVTVEVIA